jgi:hypothetical protein
VTERTQATDWTVMMAFQDVKDDFTALRSSQRPAKVVSIESALKGDRLTTERRLPDDFPKVPGSLLAGKARSRVLSASPRSSGADTSSPTALSLQTLAPAASGGLKPAKPSSACLRGALIWLPALS